MFVATAFDIFRTELLLHCEEIHVRNAVKTIVGPWLKSSSSFEGTSSRRYWKSLFDRIDEDWKKVFEGSYLDSNSEESIHQLINSWSTTSKGDPKPALLIYYWFHIKSDFPQVATQIDYKVFERERTFERVVGFAVPRSQEDVESAAQRRREKAILSTAQTGANTSTSNINIELSNQLPPKAWFNFRRGRPNIHPKQKGTMCPYPLVVPASLAPVIENIDKNSVFQILVEGEIATGKSSMVEIVVQAWITNNPDGIVTIMPMGGDFSKGGGWSTQNAFDVFLKDAKLIAQDQSEPHLIVIEDCHEFYIHSRSRYYFKGDIDLTCVSIIATTRPPYVDFVVQDIEEWSRVRLNNIKTAAKETAEQLIELTVENTRHKQQLESVFVELGSSLVALAATLFEASKSTPKVIQIDLAYRAVREELERIFDPESDHIRVLGRDPELLKYGLLVVWMLGAVECDFDDQDLARLLNVRDVSALVRALEASKEIFSIDDDGKYRCSRHPAWGQLTMRAVDNFDRLDVISSGLRERILSGSKVTGTARLDKCLSAMLFGMLYQKVAEPNDLGLMSAGRYMHNEFASAVRLFLECGTDRIGKIENKLELLLQLSSSIRRSNPNDIGQRQDLLSQVAEIIRQTISIAMENEEVNELKDFPGNILYEAAYLHNLSGKFEESKHLFSLSKNSDISVIGREKYGVMSGIRESYALLFLGQLDSAKICLDEMEVILDQLIRRENDSNLMRVKASLLSARFEIEMANRDARRAKKLVSLIEVASKETNAAFDTSTYQARVLLLEGRYAEAKEKIEESTFSQKYMEHAEGFAEAYRVLGDILLGMGEIDEALDAYKRVSPGPENPLQFRDAEILLVDSRIEKILKGNEPHDILLSGRI